MSASCSGNCDSCGESCSSRSPESLLAPANKLSNVKHVIAVVSGKGGVGKSTVTSMMAVAMNKLGYKTAILDADITGPSIPQAFGLHQRADGDGEYIYPVKTKMGIEVMSVNLLLEDETQPVVWRGPVIAGVVKQFWNEVVWNDVDYMFVDMPPGTGDVPLTVYQSIRLDGIVIVTSPQELVSMIVAKAANMAKLMNIPILGIVENMSYVKCPDCGKEIKIFGEGNTAETAKELGVPVLAKIPFDRELSKLCDNGCIELYEGDWMNEAAEKLLK